MKKTHVLKQKVLSSSLGLPSPILDRWQAVIEMVSSVQKLNLFAKKQAQVLRAEGWSKLETTFFWVGCVEDVIYQSARLNTESDIARSEVSTLGYRLIPSTH